MDDARIAVETGVDGVDVVIGTSSFLREHSHGKDMTYILKVRITWRASSLFPYYYTQTLLT